jgi:hypothetical protein
LRGVFTDMRDGAGQFLARLRGGVHFAGGLFTGHRDGHGLRVGASRRIAEPPRIVLQGRGGGMKEDHGLRHLNLELLEQRVDAGRTPSRLLQARGLLLGELFDLVRRILGEAPRLIDRRESRPDRVPDIDEHRGLGCDGDGVHARPEIVASTRIDCVRKDDVQPGMVQADQHRRRDQDAPVAETRQHGKHGEIIEVHLDLPWMAAESEHQQ